MKWHDVLASDQLPTGSRVVVSVEGHDVLLLNHEGQIYATALKCPHMGASLKKGKVVADSIVCPLHRSAFDLETGDARSWAPWPPLVGKVLGAVSPEKALTVFPVRVEDGRVWVGFEDGITEGAG
ncbi:MAG: Rieske (2Fe-2S) protein [Anaerolineae bacterium]|nr:Rieske (2Fe-2S) protein [Anaerolineae bacterium]